MAAAALDQGQVDLAALVRRIRDDFPALVFDRAALNDFGEDHAVVILDHAWVFRFPRGPAAAAFALGERRLLRHLTDVASLATPRYELVAPSGEYAGYRMITGQELTEARFDALTRSGQETVIDQIGAFLGALHATPLSLLTTDGPVRTPETGEIYATRYAENQAAFADILPTNLRRRADAFYAALPAAVAAPPLRLTHNDFTEDHILLAPDGTGLAGVIDFTDAGPGDPAFDFTFLWAYGDWAPARALSRYGPGADAGLLERSRWWFARYRLDQIWWHARGNRTYDQPHLIDHLGRLFASLGV